MDNWNSSVPSSRHCTFHDAHVASQHTSRPTKVSLFRLFGQMTLTRPADFLVCWTSNRHKSDATRSPTTGRSAHISSAPSSLSSSTSLPQPPLFPRDASATAPAPTAGIFAGIHSRPEDLVDSDHKVRFFCIPWRLVRHGASF
jgi:hypothetical protein